MIECLDEDNLERSFNIRLNNADEKNDYLKLLEYERIEVIVTRKIREKLIKRIYNDILGLDEENANSHIWLGKFQDLILEELPEKE